MLMKYSVMSVQAILATDCRLHSILYVLIENFSNNNKKIEMNCCSSIRIIESFIHVRYESRKQIDDWNNETHTQTHTNTMPFNQTFKTYK